jgi:hypothetical protein
MIASEIVAQRKQPDVDRHPAPATILSMLRPVVTSLSADMRNSQQSRSAFGLSQPLNLATVL